MLLSTAADPVVTPQSLDWRHDQKYQTIWIEAKIYSCSEEK